MNSKIEDFRTKYNKLVGAKNSLEKQLTEAKSQFRILRREFRDAEKALSLIQICAQQTQQELKYQLSELPQLALSSVFEDPYQFDVQFEIRRNSTEVDFWFVRDEEKLDPKESTGLGPVDITGMALRPALWSMQIPKTRASIWLDEPFKHLKGAGANRNALSILSEICKPKPEQNWPGLQIIMIADERASREELLEVSDCVYEFYMVGRKTRTRRLK